MLIKSLPTTPAETLTTPPNETSTTTSTDTLNVSESQTTILIGLCASKIDDLTRFEYFQQCHQSIQSQHMELKKFYLGIYCVDSLKKQILKLLENVRKNNYEIIWYEDPTPQFEIFRNLVKKVSVDFSSNLDRVFFVFTDDDDYWHQNRIKYIHNSIQQYYEDNKEFPPNVYSTYSAFLQDSKQELREFDPPIEYVHYNPPFLLANEFFTKATSTLTRHSRCDMYFRLFLEKTKDPLSLSIDEVDNWMYCYRHHRNGLSYILNRDDRCNYIIDEFLSSFYQHSNITWSIRIGKLVEENSTLASRNTLLEKPQEIFNQLGLSFIIDGYEIAKKTFLDFYNHNDYSIVVNIVFIPDNRTNEEIELFQKGLYVNVDYLCKGSLPSQVDLDRIGCMNTYTLSFHILKDQNQDFYPIDNPYSQKIVSIEYYYLNDDELIDDYP